MRYMIITHMGLDLYIARDQALKAIAFGKEQYSWEKHEDYGCQGYYMRYSFYSPDRWEYDIVIM